MSVCFFARFFVSSQYFGEIVVLCGFDTAAGRHRRLLNQRLLRSRHENKFSPPSMKIYFQIRYGFFRFAGGTRSRGFSSKQRSFQSKNGNAGCAR
jgi:hypothetical protein